MSNNKELEKLLKLKSSYDIHAIVDHLEKEKQRIEDEKYRNMIDEITLIDYSNYIEKVLYPEFAYQKEHGQKNIKKTMEFFAFIIYGVPLLMRAGISTFIACSILYGICYLGCYFKYRGTYNTYKSIWNDSSKNVQSEQALQKVMRQTLRDKKLGYDIWIKFTSPRKIKEIDNRGINIDFEDVA